MIRALLWALLLGTGPIADGQTVWLVVAASDSSPAKIATRVKAQSAQQPQGLIFQARDCGEQRNYYGWAVEIVSSAQAAQQALERVRATIQGAYVKRCRLQARSLLALGVPAIDRSIADVPARAASWSDAARVSAAMPLEDGRVLVVVRYFANNSDDELAGRRERVVLVSGTGTAITLRDPCFAVGGAVVRRGRLAFHCGGALNQELHTTLVFDAAGKQLLEIPSCSQPQWIEDQVLSCSEESRGADGQVRLATRRTRLPRQLDPL